MLSRRMNITIPIMNPITKNRQSPSPESACSSLMVVLCFDRLGWVSSTFAHVALFLLQTRLQASYVAGSELDAVILLFVPPHLVRSGLVVSGTDPVSRVVLGEPRCLLPPEVPQLRFSVVVFVVGIHDLGPSTDRARCFVAPC